MFRESEPYYSKGFSRSSLQGEISSEEKILREGGNKGDEFLELEEIGEFFGKITQKGCDIPEVQNESKASPRNEPDSSDSLQSNSEFLVDEELPTSAPLAKESTENVQNSLPQVISNPMSSESHETHFPNEIIAPRYP